MGRFYPAVDHEGLLQDQKKKKKPLGREKREKVVMGGGRWRGVATQRFAA